LCADAFVATYRAVTEGTSEARVWVWDAAKDRLNRSKHLGLSLAAGIAVLDGDPQAVSQPDPHPDGDRWQTIGNAAAVVGPVVHTDTVDDEDGNSVGRLIGMRQATARERKTYEKGDF